MIVRRTRIALALAFGALPLGALCVLPGALGEAFAPPARYRHIELAPDGIVADGTLWIETPTDSEAHLPQEFDQEARSAYNDLLGSEWFGVLLGQGYLRRFPDGSAHLGRPLRVSASSSAPLRLLGMVLFPPRNLQPDARDTILLEVGDRLIPLFWNRPKHDSGTSRCLLLEDTLTSYFEGGDRCDHLVFSLPFDPNHGQERLRAAFLALPRAASAKPLQILPDLPSDAPFERLASTLRALDTTRTPPAVRYEPYRYGREVERIRKIRLRSQGRDWLSPKEQRRFVPEFVAPLGDTESGLGLVGMERIQFERVDARDMAWDAPEALALLPLSWSTQALWERPESTSVLLKSNEPAWKDFRISPVLLGHDFELRQVVNRVDGILQAPIWWALYDNGRRSGIWRGSDGFEIRAVQTRYRQRPFLGGKGERFAVCLRSERRSELEFLATPAGLVLESRKEMGACPQEGPP